MFPKVLVLCTSILLKKINHRCSLLYVPLNMIFMHNYIISKKFIIDAHFYMFH